MDIRRTGIGIVSLVALGLALMGCGGSGGSLVTPPAILVMDYGNNRLTKIRGFSDTTFTATFGSAGTGVGQFSGPTAISADADKRLYIVDNGNHRLVRINDSTGAGWTSFGSFGAGVNQLNLPTGVAVDGSGRIYITDSANNRIVRINDMTGAGWTTFGSFGSGTNQFSNPFGIHILPNGDIVVADSGNNRIVKIDNMTGAGWTALGSLGSGTNQFNLPIGINNDLAGNILVCDSGNDRIVRFEDMTGFGWTALNSTVANPFDGPAFIDVDSGGRYYFTCFSPSGLLYRVNGITGSGFKSFGTVGTGQAQYNQTTGIIVRL